LSIHRSWPILLASDFPIFRESLKAHFDKASELELVACANDREEIIPLMETHLPKLVLLDLDLDCDELCALLDGIHRRTDVRSLIMADDIQSSRVIRLLQHGANGVVPRRTSQELFTKSITTVLAGDYWVSRAMITHFVNLMRKGESADLTKSTENLVQPESALPGGPTKAGSSQAPEVSRFGLTRRETQVISALVDGQTNKDIANTYGISEYTVKHHLTSVYDKLGVYNRVELVLFAMNHGLSAGNLVSSAV
jgi:two-component system, NarL family, nitrate/nitrite response regulator NarL